MARIIEIWRKPAAAGLPVRYTVGNNPVLASGDSVDDVIVSAIDYRETGALAGKRLNAPVFVIDFEDSFIQRFIPVGEIIDIAYETKEAEKVKTPALEA